MAKARWADGLRRGSTRSKTYSTLSTQKEGRVQIIKDRVYDVANPQTGKQMVRRISFATVTKAASLMLPLISISREGIDNPEYARQQFVSENVKLLSELAGKRSGVNRHFLAAFAPKGNTQLIPNSYIVSKGSLSVPKYLIPRTADDSGSFGAAAFSKMQNGPGGYSLGTLTEGQSYNAAQIWQKWLGLLPGDQLTFPQIYGDGIAQAIYTGEDQEGIWDKTLYTSWCAPRLVLKTEMPATSITMTTETTDAEVRAILRGGIDEVASWETLVDNFINNIGADDHIEDEFFYVIDKTFDYIFCVNNDDPCRALGVILSRYDSASSKWLYSTSQLVCVWDHLAQNSGQDYFGFRYDTAIETYKDGVQSLGDGNFLQRGGEADIMPGSFA